MRPCPRRGIERGSRSRTRLRGVKPVAVAVTRVFVVPLMGLSARIGLGGGSSRVMGGSGPSRVTVGTVRRGDGRHRFVAGDDGADSFRLPSAGQDWERVPQRDTDQGQRTDHGERDEASDDTAAGAGGRCARARLGRVAPTAGRPASSRRCPRSPSRMCAALRSGRQCSAYGSWSAGGIRWPPSRTGTTTRPARIASVSSKTIGSGRPSRTPWGSTPAIQSGPTSASDMGRPTDRRHHLAVPVAAHRQRGDVLEDPIAPVPLPQGACVSAAAYPASSRR